MLDSSMSHFLRTWRHPGGPSTGCIVVAQQAPGPVTCVRAGDVAARIHESVLSGIK